MPVGRESASLRWIFRMLIPSLGRVNSEASAFRLGTAQAAGQGLDHQLVSTFAFLFAYLSENTRPDRCATVPMRLTLYTARIVFFSLRRRLKLRYYIACAAVNMIFSTLNEREIQARSLSTTEAYQKWLASKVKHTKDQALQKRLTQEIQPLEETGGRLLWIGNRRKATKFVLFFHGGGFVSGALPGHFEWCWNAYVMAGREVGVEVAVCFLHYTLLSEGRFPVPLQQASAALGELLDDGISPSDIIIGGDSAGGNLTVQVMSHLLHPVDDVRRIELQEPLNGIFLVSPWLSTNVHAGSFKENHGRDMISTGAIKALSAALYGKEKVAQHRQDILSGNYADANPHETPLEAGEAWLDNLGNLTPRVYVTVGGNEVLRDQGNDLVKLLKRRNVTSEIRHEQAEDEAHDFILLEGVFNEVGDATNRMKDWFKSAITAS